ncbi:HlyD family secretion protein [Massilia sp. IC2-477]|uniref:HlyD family secretion protein n=1 Tax=Massilia sp. IC2-477 TaxID=2887198 RepID=UPI001D0FE5ED|nr:HlyD family secretion protein [Massilia sp. IC2-477]MCC2957162.1 HlyD family secretion protein [Massilia sp. IC2-477]
MAESHTPAQQSPVSAPAPAAPVKTPPNKRVLGVVALIALVALGAGGRMWYRSSHFVETENAYVTGRVHPVSSRVAGVVTRVLVDDNQIVKAGDVIAELDPADHRVRIEQIEAQIASAEQQIGQADAQVAQVKAQAAAAGAQVKQSEAQLVRARQDAERFGQLYNDTMKAVSRAEVDASSAARAAATADVAARRESASAALAQVNAASAGRDVLKAQVKVLQAQLKDARQQLAYNQIVAPVAGRVGKRSVEVGARVQPGQQLLAVVEDEVWVTANFKETQLAGLEPGQQVSLEVDALPGKHLMGRVHSFSPASGAQFALLPADNATGNFTKIVQRVPVKIVLDPNDVKKYAGRLVPGMSVVAEVELGQKVQHTQTAAVAH